MFDKLKTINWNKANLQDGKTYRKITTYERFVYVKPNQTKQYKIMYGLFLVIGFLVTLFFTITFPVTLNQVINWIILFIAIEFIVVVFFTGIIIITGITDRTFKVLQNKKKSFKKTQTYELLEDVST